MATTYRITAKHTAFSGDVAGVAFSRGTGEAVDPAPNVLAYSRRHGYGVEEVDAAPNGGQGPGGRMPARSASKADWKAYAVAHGMSEEDADAATRDQLAAHFHEHHAEQDD